MKKKISLFEKYIEHYEPKFELDYNDITFCSGRQCSECLVARTCNDISPVYRPALNDSEKLLIKQTHPELLI